MYAVIQIGSSQFKVSEGDVISADRIKEEEGKDITLDKVLMFAKGADVRIGQPLLKDVKVSAKVVQHNAADKLVAFKYRRRKNSSTLKGQRKKLTSLSITKISA